MPKATGIISQPATSWNAAAAALLVASRSPITVTRSTLVTRAMGIALATKTTRSQIGRRMSRATAVDRAKKVMSMRKPLQASATSISASPRWMTFPSATAGIPMGLQEKGTAHRRQPSERLGEGDSHAVGEGNHENEEQHRGLRPAPGLRAAQQEKDPGDGRKQGDLIDPDEMKVSAKQAQKNAACEDREAPPRGVETPRTQTVPAIPQEDQREDWYEVAVRVLGVVSPALADFLERRPVRPQETAEAEYAGKREERGVCATVESVDHDVSL